jgi:hypothetical protein
MKYLVLSSIFILFWSCNKPPKQEAILKKLFKEEFKYELPLNAIIITLPTEACPSCNVTAKQCYRKISYKPEVIAVCTDTIQLQYISGAKRIFWDKNKAITKYQIGQQPYYIELKNGKITSMLEFSRENYLVILQKIEKL